MKYTIRLFIYGDEIVFKEYNFNQLPYMPRVGEIVTVSNEYGINSFYIVKDIVSSFDITSEDNCTVDYTIQEVYY